MMWTVKSDSAPCATNSVNRSVNRFTHCVDCVSNCSTAVDISCTSCRSDRGSYCRSFTRSYGNSTENNYYASVSVDINSRRIIGKTKQILFFLKIMLPISCKQNN